MERLTERKSDRGGDSANIQRLNRSVELCDKDNLNDGTIWQREY